MTDRASAEREGLEKLFEAVHPFAWVLPGDDTAKADGWIDARVSEWSEFTKPLYSMAEIRAALASVPAAEAPSGPIDYADEVNRQRAHITRLNAEVMELKRRLMERDASAAGAKSDSQNHIVVSTISDLTDTMPSSLNDACRRLDVAREEIERLRALVEGRNNRPREFLAWAVEMFGPVAKLRSERLMRFVEEAIELAHADQMERTVLDIIINRVYSREPGQINKEVGQAQACLETYAENIGESANLLAEIEWQRVRQIPRAEWQRRHAAKQAIGMALPSTERNHG